MYQLLGMMVFTDSLKARFTALFRILSGQKKG